MASNRQETRKPTPLDAEVGEMVRDIMYRKQVGVRALSLRVGRHENSVGRLLRGDAAWRLNDLQPIAEALGMRLVVKLEPFTPAGLPSHAEAEEAKWDAVARERDES